MFDERGTLFGMNSSGPSREHVACGMACSALEAANGQGHRYEKSAQHCTAHTLDPPACLVTDGTHVLYSPCATPFLELTYVCTRPLEPARADREDEDVLASSSTPTAGERAGDHSRADATFASNGSLKAQVTTSLLLSSAAPVEDHSKSENVSGSPKGPVLTITNHHLCAEYSFHMSSAVSWLQARHTCLLEGTHTEYGDPYSTHPNLF